MNRSRVFRWRSIILLLSIFMLEGCKTSVSTTSASTATNKDPIEGLIFLTFVMRGDSVSGNRVELIGKTIVHEKLKSDPQNSDLPNRVWVDQLNKSGEKLSSVALDHPLFRRVEFANDKGEFQSKMLKLTDAEFFARVTLYTQTEYIEVVEELSGKIIHSTRFTVRD